MIVSKSGGLTAGLLILAGLYQLTPLKQACLRRCRSPLGFLMAEWRDGLRGALAMGLKHGLWCAGCCWALMLLLFVAGAMNPVWIAFLTVAVALEKWPRLPAWLTRAYGAALLLAGAAVLLRPAVGGAQGPVQSNGMCLAELTSQENSKPKALTLQTVALPQVTSCGPGPVSEPGALARRGYSPGLLVGPVSASAQAVTLPAISTPQRDWSGAISKEILARSAPRSWRPSVNRAATLPGKPPGAGRR